jgi:hypothetical protein
MSASTSSACTQQPTPHARRVAVLAPNVTVSLAR